MCGYTFERECECPVGSLCGCEALFCAANSCVFFGWYKFLLVHRVDLPAFCHVLRRHSVQAFSHDAYGGGASVQRKYPFNLLVHSQRSFYSFIDSVNGSFVA